MKQLLFAWFTCVGLAAAGQEILVPPYLQPGNAPTLYKEQKVLIWHTDSIPGVFKVEFAKGEILSSPAKIANAKVNPVRLHIGGKTTILYRAALPGLNFDAAYTYRVSLGGKIMSEATFLTRTKKPATRFVLFGDCGTGSPEQKAIAYQVLLQKPQFVLVAGDNVYSSGLVKEYHARFFPVYLSPESSPDKGAPLMKTIPFYMLVGNHDVQATDLDKIPDGLAFFYFNDLPLNAPVAEHTVRAAGSPETVKAFEKATGGRYPRLTNYSFDYGNVHITCLDANVYANPLEAGLVEWMKKDIASSKADWKIVAFHQPGFNASSAHYNYQPMRLLSPLLEELGVDMVLCGHVHNYQRTVPLRFAPKKNAAGDRYVLTPEGRVDGVFTLDEKFDGRSVTKPNGIIYIVSGAGGAGLYDAAISNKPDLWKHEPPENWVPFTVKLVSDIHSFTVIETEGKKLTLRQLNAQGVAFDEIHVTK
jgi:predicted MPP superfamily phosphohydrolase